MTDKISKEARSRNMSHIHSNNTKPEITVRKYLFSKGLRYRLYDKRFPGKPDLIFPKYNTAVFVNGCFWHHHNCKFGTTPKSNTGYWVEKFKKNQDRDLKNYESLKAIGWKVIIVWECDLKNKNVENTLKNLYKEITNREEL
ncbi:very short patch repair endonuclease [Enterococcus faecium]|uniref:very short patch repair endonuclease n=2 Tax=Enterococcus faecium TaxID=1352 RepID=UPI00032D992D|nr:DNA mismatch endonuclease Vsr [Enterococcus faecium]EGO9938281.1 DNA mismatch endonuclease Vsr [Enterococcus faecium]EGP4840460.1 DNA mismatch endonuclease Vsr [Enterococcus faecium]EKZ0100417.1 DNA mismatch endonuclease Vsr [Enterococcus faecium]EOG03868.1 DNA mismatch endonuclease Vsr [Enterococcus faecium EnGen0171]EOK12615.1 DNA mismatch endonuclease Vsr [Enterococcus faecium EnGen0372]